MHRKLLTLTQTSVKFDADKPRHFSGYASVFGGVDSYGDSIVKGAYAKTLEGRQRPVMMRWNHHGPVIGKWLEMREDDVGLFVRGELTPGHSVASDVMASMAHGAVDGLSIGYYVDDYEVINGVRYLKAISLREISIVEEPADNAARITELKSAIDDAMTLKEIESLLRDAGGFSKAQATALVSRVRAIALGDQAAKSQTDELLNLIKRNTALITKGKN